MADVGAETQSRGIAHWLGSGLNLLHEAVASRSGRHGNQCTLHAQRDLDPSQVFFLLFLEKLWAFLLLWEIPILNQKQQFCVTY